MKRPYFIAAAAVALMGLVAGCSTQNQSNTGNSTKTTTGSTQTNSGGKVTLTMWNRYPELDSSLQTFIQGFEKQYPNISVKLQNIPVSSNTAQYQTAVSSNSLPDIFTTGAPSLQQLTQLNQIHSLDSLFPQSVQSEFVPGSFVQGSTTLNGHVYVMPLYSPNHGAYMLYYNKDVLNKYGISTNQLPKTWSQLMSIGQDIYSKSHGSVHALIEGNDSWMYRTIAWEMGTAISPDTPQTFNYSTGKPDFNTQGEIQTAEFLKSMLKNNVLDPQALQVSEAQARALFASGKDAFMISGDWEGADFINSLNFKDWGISALPTKNGSPYYQEAGSQANGLEVSQNTKHWPQVKTFLEYCLKNIYAQAIVQPAVALPAMKNVNATPAFPQFNDIEKQANATSKVVPNPNVRNAATITFMQNYNDDLKQGDDGNAILGYLTGQVKDISSELNTLNTQANQSFQKNLQSDKSVSASDFKFPNWTPFTNYTTQDYKALSK